MKREKIRKNKKREYNSDIPSKCAEMPDTIVGILQRGVRGAMVVTDHKQIKTDIQISSSRIGMADYGDKVLVRLLKWRRNSRYPEGEVIDILGAAGENETEMNAILAEYGLPYGYPEELTLEAEKISDGIDQQELLRRYDMRDVATFTIDPEDAKDFDDALSVRHLDNDLIEVGVHIADVTHYVKPDTAIDKEAYSRATSVYLVDRTVPMLPEHLCNEVCSLRPDEDKLTFSVIFTLNQEAEVQKYSIKKTCIRSDKRFTYEQAQAILDSGNGVFAEELTQLNMLARKLRQKRFEHGSIAFERDEVKFRLDEQQKPIGVYFKHPMDANYLIEEFMLLANRTVAEHIGKQNKLFVYRIHDLPDPDKIRNLTALAAQFGHNLRLNSHKQATSKNVNKLLNSVKGEACQNLIETVTIRSMAKAAYSTDNIGHYGLNFPYYTHFTSPIRRYPDIMVHRMLTKYLKSSAAFDKSMYETMCQHCSSMEQTAANAERASIKYKQVEFMQDKVGLQYDGIVSGVTEFGLFVELNENHCEGFLPIRELGEGFFDYNEKEFCIEDLRTGKKIQLGDKVRVEILRTDLMRKQLDLSLVQ